MFLGCYGGRGQGRKCVHITSALKRHGYPRWSIEKVKDFVINKVKNGKGKKNLKNGKGQIQRLCGYSIYQRLIRKHSQGNEKSWHISIYATTLHTDERLPSQDKVENRVRHSVTQFEFKYIGELGRKFNTGLSEYQKDAKSVPQVYNRSERKSSEVCTCINKSAMTDYIAKANHAIDW